MASAILRKLRGRLANVVVATGQNKPGFFTRYDYVSSVGDNIPVYEDVEALLKTNDEAFKDLVVRLGSTIPDLEAHLDKGSLPWELEGMFPVLDTVVLYHMVRELRPKQVLEIGSGASSHIISAAIKDNGQGKLTCIDPAPRRSITETGAKIQKRTLQFSDANMARELEEDDILFIDSSHIMLEGMDVDIQFNRMFPKLSPGVVVHVHDIFLPECYPEDWRNRNYSEQNALMGWILSGYFDVVYPGYYVATRFGEHLSQVLGARMPARPERNAGSIWLRRSSRV